VTTLVSPTALPSQKTIFPSISAKPDTPASLRPRPKSKAVARATGKHRLLPSQLPIISPRHRPYACLHSQLRGPVGLSELEDYSYNPTNPRRRTNSFSAAAGHNLYKSKFEAVDPEVIEFDEDLHGAPMLSAEDKENELEKMSSSSSAGTTGSIEEEESAKSK